MTKAYWTATGIFAALLLMDGLGGVTRSPLGEEVLLHLGYPLYLMPFLGALKILAAAAVLQTRFSAIKEWAYAGLHLTVSVRLYRGSLWGTVVSTCSSPGYFFCLARCRMRCGKVLLYLNGSNFPAWTAREPVPQFDLVIRSNADSAITINCIDPSGWHSAVATLKEYSMAKRPSPLRLYP